MKNAKARRLFALLVLCFFMLSNTEAWGCTSLIVGKDASASGYPMFSRTEDSVSYSAKRFFVYPTGYYKKGQTIVDPSYGWSWTWTHDSHRMTATPDMPVNGANVYDQAGVNEHGFMMSTTNTTTQSNNIPTAGRTRRPGGFAESLMNTVILGEAATSEEALKIWGDIVEDPNQGMSEMCFWMMNDANGDLWITENCGGFRWVAARVPDDSFVVVANDNVIDYVDLADTKNFRGSKDLIQYAIDNNFAVYGPAGTPEASKVNIAASYGNQNATGNSYRRWMGYNMFASSQNIELKTAYNATVVSPDPYPYKTFVKPDKKISAIDIMEFQRSRFEGTPYDIGESPMAFATTRISQGNGTYVHMVGESENVRIQNVNDPSTTIVARPIGHVTQKETHIYEQLPQLPKEIGARWWFLEGQPEHSMNLPFYGNINDTHPAYKKLVPFRAYDPESAFWIFRETSYLARSNRKQYGKPIHAYYKAYEAKLYAEQEAVTKELIDKFNKDPKDAAEWITDYTFATSQAAMNRAGLIRKALLKHIETKSGDLFVVPSDSMPYVNAHFEIHPTSGDAILTSSDIYDIANVLGISEWTLKAAELVLPDPYPLQQFTPILYTVQDLESGHPGALGDNATVLSTPGIRISGNLITPTPGPNVVRSNLSKVRYTAEIMGDAYQKFDNSVEKVKKGFSLHAMLPGFSKGCELVGPNGVITLPELIKTGKAWVFGDATRATVMVDFYLYDDAGKPAFGNGGKLVVPDGVADGVLDSGPMWAAAYDVKEDDKDDDKDSIGNIIDDIIDESGCQVLPLGSLLGIAMLGFMLRRKINK